MCVRVCVVCACVRVCVRMCMCVGGGIAYIMPVSLISWAAVCVPRFGVLSAVADKLSEKKFSYALKKWMASMSIWRKTQEQKKPLHIVQFDSLVEDFEPELRKLASFLKLPVAEKDIQCVTRNRMETYKRSKSRGPSPYSQDQANQIHSAIMSYKYIWDAHNINYTKWKW